MACLRGKPSISLRAKTPKVRAIHLKAASPFGRISGSRGQLSGCHTDWRLFRGLPLADRWAGKSETVGELERRHDPREIDHDRGMPHRMIEAASGWHSRMDGA